MIGHQYMAKCARCICHLICRFGGTDLTLAPRLWQCHDGGTRGAQAAAREEDARSTDRAGGRGRERREGGRDLTERSQSLQSSSFKSTYTLFKSKGFPGPRGPAGPRDDFSGRGPGPGPAGPRELHPNPNLSKIHQYLAEI